MEMLGPGGLEALNNLLKQPEAQSDSEDEKPGAYATRLGPGDIGPQKKQSTKPDAEKSAPKSDPKAIWESEEVVEGAEFDDTLDPRPQPEYDIVYKQAVSSEEVYLQLGNRTPATSSCEDMIVKIQLPDTKMSDVNLNVESKFLDCRSPKYRLGLHLPHPVDSQSGKAQWDGKSHTLSVVLRMKRDYDMFNF